MSPELQREIYQLAAGNGAPAPPLGPFSARPWLEEVLANFVLSTRRGHWLLRARRGRRERYVPHKVEDRKVA